MIHMPQSDVTLNITILIMSFAVNEKFDFFIF